MPPTIPLRIINTKIYEILHVQIYAMLHLRKFHSSSRIHHWPPSTLSYDKQLQPTSAIARQHGRACYGRLAPPTTTQLVTSRRMVGDVGRLPLGLPRLADGNITGGSPYSGNQLRPFPSGVESGSRPSGAPGCLRAPPWGPSPHRSDLASLPSSTPPSGGSPLSDQCYALEWRLATPSVRVGVGHLVLRV